MPVAELRASYRPARNTVVLAVGYRFARSSVQVDNLRIRYTPFAELPAGEFVLEPLAEAQAVRPAGVAAAGAVVARATPARPVVVPRASLRSRRVLDRAGRKVVDGAHFPDRDLRRVGWTFWRPANTGKDGTHPAGVEVLVRHAEHDPRKMAGLYAPRTLTGKDPGKVGYRSGPRSFADKDGRHAAQAVWPRALAGKAPEKVGHVLWTPRLVGKDAGKVALVDWQLPRLIFQVGNTIIMWPHVLAVRPTGYVAKVLPRRPQAHRELPEREARALVASSWAGRPNEVPGWAVVGLVGGGRPWEQAATVAGLAAPRQRIEWHHGTVLAPVGAARIPDQLAVVAPIIGGWRDPTHAASIEVGVAAEVGIDRPASVAGAMAPGVREVSHEAGVIRGVAPIEWLRGTVVVVWPHVLGGRPPVREAVLVPHLRGGDRDDERGALQLSWAPPALRLQDHGGAVLPIPGAGGTDARAAILARYMAARGTDIRPAVVRGLAGSGYRPPVLDAVVAALRLAGQRPTVHGGVLVQLAAAGQRPTVHGAVVWPVPRVGATEDRAAVMVRLPVAAREIVEPGLVIWRTPLLVPVPKLALIVPGQAPVDLAPKEARIEAGLLVDRDTGLLALEEPGQELLGYGNAAPYMPGPEDNTRPYDPPQEPWPETDPITGPYNPPPDPITDPETGQPINPPPTNHQDPPPNPIADPVTGEPRHPTGGTDPVTGDPEILPPTDPAEVPGDMCGAIDEVDVPEGVLLEWIRRFWDIWQTYQVYYGHVTAQEAIQHLLRELVRWLSENEYDARYWILYCDFKDCARAAVMRYCRTYLRRQWGKERNAELDYGTDAFNTGTFQDASRWTVDGWSFRYHLVPTDIALAPDRDRATVTLSCNLPLGGLVDFEYLIAFGNGMKLRALPSGQVLWSAQGWVEDPFEIPGPHARIEVPPGTTVLQWEFEWGATARHESVDYGQDAFNEGRFMDPARWIVSGWSFQRQNDPDEYTDDITLAPTVDGGTATLTCNLPDGGRVQFEYGVANGNLLELVALPSGQGLWSSGGTLPDPYGVPGPMATVELPPGTTGVQWRFHGSTVPPSGLRAYIDIVTLYRYTLERTAPPSGLPAIFDVVTLWRYVDRDVLVGAWPETVCEPNRGNDAVRDTWECWRRKWEDRHKGKSLRRRWLVT